MSCKLHRGEWVEYFQLFKMSRPVPPPRPTWRGVSEKEKLLERAAGVAESSGRIQVSVKPKMLSVDCKEKAEMKSALLTADWQFQRATEKERGVVDVEMGRRFAGLRRLAGFFWLEIKTCGLWWAIPITSISRVEGARSCPEAERAGPARSEYPRGADIGKESALRTMSGMARKGLRVEDGHRSPSPCTGLPESAWLAETHTASCPAKCEQAHLCPEVPGDSGRTKAGIGKTPVMQRGPRRRTNPKFGLLFDGSTSIPSLELLSRQKIVCEVQNSREHESLSRRGTCPDTKGGDGTHACLLCWQLTDHSREPQRKKVV